VLAAYKGKALGREQAAAPSQRPSRASFSQPGVSRSPKRFALAAACLSGRGSQSSVAAARSRPRSISARAGPGVPVRYSSEAPADQPQRPDLGERTRAC
jgi:hypothetical protein